MARSKLVLSVLGTAAALAVAGCGSVTAGAGQAGAASGHASATSSGGSAAAGGQANAVGGPIRGVSPLLCAAPASASRVIITRIGAAGPISPAGPVVSADRSGPPSAAPVVKGAAQASALARAVCGLPVLTGRVLNCPQLDGISYQLAFSASGRLLPAVIVQPSGCQTVTGAGRPRTAARRPAFLKLLTSMVGPVRLPGAVHLPGTAVGSGPLRPLARTSR
jgi:hypothetical protein